MTRALLLFVAILASLPCAEAYAKKQPARKASRQSAARQAPVNFDAAAINNPQQGDVAPETKSSGVVRAQILLARAHFSCGEIDGYFGTYLKRTLSAYQDDRNLPVTGALDAATWGSLNADTAPALIQYAISQEDVAGPFTPIPKTMKEQAKLPRLGYATPLEALSEKFHASPALMKALNPGANFGQAGQQLMAPNVIVMPPGRAAQIIVSKGESSVRAYDENGRLLSFAIATAGSEHDPLPLGDWKVKGVAREPPFHYNPELFWDAKPGDSKTVLKPGPNNPVGLVWIDLSREHTGIHGTAEPSRVGHVYSHGCIRLTNWDAVELASMVKPGTPALLKE